MRPRRFLNLTYLLAASLLLGTVAWVLSLLPPSVPRPSTLAAGVGLLALATAVVAAFFALRQSRYLRNESAELIRAADRISRGDFTQPLIDDDLGTPDELQRAFEHMRIALRQTTYSRDYLHSVLNSMSDSVFVTTPDGAIRIANEAAQRLTGYSEPELLGMNVDALIEHAAGDAQLALATAREAGEAVIRTNPGQTIPVSFIASTIASDDSQFAGEIYVARDITERKRAERRIRYLARYDALTKIPNRMQFQHLLQQAIARGRRVDQGLALLYVDMDHFKEVNDTFGHTSGDRVLEVLTERLTRVLPSEAVLGRLAGDEFAVFIDGMDAEGESSREQVVQLARTVLDAAGAAFHISQQEVFLSVSIGVAFCPRDADNVIDLIRNADAAMYHAKQNGGNSFALYSQDMNAAAVERLMLKSKLRRAVERNEFIVNYMPKVDVRDGSIVGAEALLRWRLPGHGDIPPAQFIPLAEENNLIDAIGEWVLERVCIDLRLMKRTIEVPGRIALNLSLKQLRQATFILKCHSVFERHKIPPQDIELEITESTLMADPPRTIQLLNQLAAMGLHLSIDDFGIGYSSLSALQQFPIGSLKVDQSFVRDLVEDPGDATLVKTIIDMGHGLGMEVVAEGVETLAQLRFLRSKNCDQLQGRLFGEPMRIEALHEKLAAQQHGRPAFAELFAEATARPLTA